jgi:hypothetical protein
MNSSTLVPPVITPFTWPAAALTASIRPTRSSTGPSSPSLYALDPFDPLTADDPQYAFDIGAAGAYTVTVGSFQPEIALTIQPYVGDQNAAVAVLCGSVQCAAALLAAGLVYRRLTRAQRLAHAADQQARRDRMATFLDDPGRRKPK